MGFLYLIAGRKSLLVGKDHRNDIVIGNAPDVPLSISITPSDDANTAYLRVGNKPGRENKNVSIRVNHDSYCAGSGVLICKSDYIYISNYLFVWLKNYIYICMADNRETVPPKVKGIRPVKASVELAKVRVNYRKKFVPSVRKRRLYDDSEIEIEAPPTRRVPEKTSLSLAVGPALTMAIPLLLGAGRNVSVLSSIFAAIWAAMNVVNHRKKMKNEEKRRRNSYISYIKECDEKIQKCAKEYRSIQEEYYPAVYAYLRGGPNPFLLWNRSIDSEDNMNIRLGIGECDFPNVIKIPRDRFAGVDDSLRELPGNLSRRYSKLSGCPVIADLKSNRAVGLVYDDYKRLIPVLNSIVLQIAVAFSPDYLRISFMVDDPFVGKEFKWIKYLPHYEESEDTEDAQNSDEKGNAATRIILTNEMLPALEIAANENCFQIFLCRSLARMPSFVNMVLSCTNAYSGVLCVGNNKNARQSIRFDTVSEIVSGEYARMLGRVWGNKSVNRISLPAIVTFDRLYGYDFSAVDILQKWNTADTAKSLGFPIGIGENNKIIILDLHESFSGPHGIIAGTTGSGKSELLSTMILSAAMNYPPDKLGFFLIDYKGGGMSNSFKSLPHILGSISNLSNATIQRAMTSIKSENIRRQQIFNEYGVNNIRDYTRAYDDKKISIPVPHVLIIIDEFAELKKDNPEFMQELISVAAVGRSLGVHLILATQKPAGVVDDKIRSNSRFRICLRVEDKTDSNDMLHNTDAALIRECGRGYLQVGNDEVYEKFQSAYAMGRRCRNGAGHAIEIKGEYKNSIPVQDTRSAQAENQTGVINVQKGDVSDVTATVIAGADGHQEDSTDITWHQYLLEEIRKSDELYSYRKPDKLWLPPLPQIISTEEAVQLLTGKNCRKSYEEPGRSTYEESVTKSYEKTGRKSDSISKCIIGIADNPNNQSYEAVEYSPELSGNTCIMGSSGSGKSEMLKVILHGIVSSYDSEMVNCYIVDNGGNKLKPYDEVNQCGGYINSENQKHILMLLYYLSDILKQRRKNQGEMNNNYPVIILVIDNYSESVREISESAEPLLQDIIKYGPSVGMYLIISAASVGMGELPARFLDGMDTVYCLGKMEAYIVSGYIKQPARTVPMIVDCPGRGIGVINNTVLEFQTLECDFETITNDIYCRNSINKSKVARYPYIPEKPDLELFLDRAHMECKANDIPQRGIPVGYIEKTGRLYYLPVHNTKITIVIGREGTGKKTFLDLLSIVSAGYGYQMYSVDSTSVLQYLISEAEQNPTQQYLIRIDDFGKILKEEPGTGVAPRYFDNTGSKNSNVHILAIMQAKERDYGFANQHEIWHAVMKKPYVVCFGGNLDEQRLFDFSYLSYMAQNQEKDPGRCHVRKFGGKYFYGDAVIPCLLPGDDNTMLD